MKKYDVIVIGAGGMGSAACYQLAKRGVSVLGIEQFTRAHDRGSSHGNTRLIRKAYFEHPDYVPLCERAYEGWEELHEECGRQLFHRTGLVIFGSAGPNEVLDGVLHSARLHSLEVEEVTGDNVRERFPQFSPPPGSRAVWEPGAGFLEVETCVNAHLDCALNRGADVRFNEEVLSWSAREDAVEVKTNRGEYAAQRLVIAAGPWSGKILADLGLPLVVRRVPQLWFAGPPSLAESAGAPCYAFALPEGFFYGVPARDGFGVKLASHVPGSVVSDPTHLERNLLPEDLAAVERVRRDLIPGLAPKPERHAICMYTLTPNENFILDTHPRFPSVSFVAGLSGHGFKFAPVLGEALADLAVLGATSLPVGFLKLR